MSGKILAFSGSAREGSFNQKLVGVAARAAEAAGADVKVINLKDYPLPLYNADEEHEKGLPSTALELKQLFKEADGFLVSSPEYNGFFTPLLKNAIDWISRPHEGEKPLEAFTGKVAGIMSASPGALGGLRGLPALLALLNNLKVTVIGETKAVGKAGEAFDDNGDLIDTSTKNAIESIGKLCAEAISC